MIKLLFLVVFTCSFCHLKAQPVDQRADKQSIELLRDQWASYLQNKQLEKAVDQYADNAIFFNPDGTNATGKNEIRKLYHQVMAQFNSNIRFSSTGIQISGTIAYDSGNYQEDLVNNATHKKLSIKGSYLMVLQKQNTGWKISRLMWTQ